MKLLKFILFFSILISIFIIVFRNSENKGLRKSWISFRIAIVIAASLASLSYERAEAVSNSQVVRERLVSNQEFNLFEENDRQVILVKSDGNPVIPPTRRSKPSNFPITPPRPSRPVSGVNPYRIPPKVVNQGPGGAANPGGGGGGAEFDSNDGNDNFCPLPKKEQLQTSDNEYFLTSDYRLERKKINKKDYGQVMDELESQRDKKTVTITLGDKVYEIKNPYKDGAMDLQDELAKQLYKEFRKDKKDVAEIAEKNTLKKENVQKCKDHIFNNEHILDRYEHLGIPIEVKKFDPNLNQALAWQRFKDGIPTEADLEWLKHEFLEQAYEAKNYAGYKECHNYAQKRFNGDPWHPWINKADN